MRDGDVWFLHPIVPGGAGFLTPHSSPGEAFSPQEEGCMERCMEATVTEIHGYPSRPAGFAEPLFWNKEKKRELMDHFAEASWLVRASELYRGPGRASQPATGQASHSFGEGRREIVEVRRRPGGGLELLRGCDRGGGSGRGYDNRRCGRKRRSRKPVLGLIERWREVRDWWDEGGGTDFYVYRFLLSDGSVVDVARNRGSWTLVGIVD